jgi:hypothetical protein
MFNFLDVSNRFEIVKKELTPYKVHKKNGNPRIQIGQPILALRSSFFFDSIGVNYCSIIFLTDIVLSTVTSIK